MIRTLYRQLTVDVLLFLVNSACDTLYWDFCFCLHNYLKPNRCEFFCNVYNRYNGMNTVSIKMMYSFQNAKDILVV